MASRLALTPESAHFPTANYPQQKRDAAGRPVLAFDQTTNETVYWSSVAPQNFVSAGGNCAVVVTYYCTTTSNTSHNVCFIANIETPSTSENLSTGTFFGAGGWVRSQVPSTVAGGGGFKQETIQLPATNIDGLAVGNYFRLGLTRDAGNVFDTANGDVNVVMVEFRDVAS
jgi:hypothetical protein